MNTLDRQVLSRFVNDNIVSFHEARLAKLKRINLNDVLKSKNPYLFRAKNITQASDLITSIMTAYVSSSEEGMFGKFLEDLAIHISSQSCGGWKSSTAGLDLEFDRDGTRYLVAIKSGPNWGNNSQYERLEQYFAKAVQRLQQSSHMTHLQPVLGICYGNKSFKSTGMYWVMTGQRFWHFLCGDKSLYTDIIEPIGYQAKQHNDAYSEKMGALHNHLIAEFIERFCDADGTINWESLVVFNSGNMSDAEA